LLIDPREHKVAGDESARISERLQDITYRARVYVEEGFRSRFEPMLAVLGVAIALLVLGATFMATGLAAADARPDLTSMFAVGATSRTRRAFVAGQAAIISGAGVVLGVLSGLVPGLVTAAQRTPGPGGGAFTYSSQGEVVAATARDMLVIDIPWSLFAGIVIGLPLLAALVAGLFARTRVMLTRRIA
jgi:putative ABC transport system permease protein